MFKAICYSILLAMFLCACASSDRTRLDANILEYQKEISRLESELSNRDIAVDNAIQRIREITKRSEGIEGDIDEVIELFDEYQRAVERLLQDYRAARSTVDTKDKID